MPVHAEAHDLKFAEGYFDAILCLDAYHYFGTDEMYLPYLAKFLRPGGTIGIALPSIVAEFVGNQVPEHLQSSWSADWWTFHSPLWWRQLWERSAVVEVDRADPLEDGWRDWARWYDVRADVTGDEKARRKAELARLDAGRNLGFARVVARRPS